MPDDRCRWTKGGRCKREATLTYLTVPLCHAHWTRLTKLMDDADQQLPGLLKKLGVREMAKECN